MSEFQSHEAEFDYLKSIEIDEHIQRISWVPQQQQAKVLLTANQKLIKLWKVWPGLGGERQP